MLPQIEGGKFFKDIPINPYYSGEAKDGWRLDKNGTTYTLVAKDNNNNIVGSTLIETPLFKIEALEVNNDFKN